VATPKNNISQGQTNTKLGGNVRLESWPKSWLVGYQASLLASPPIIFSAEKKINYKIIVKRKKIQY
jgi:hypothetical protein